MANISITNPSIANSETADVTKLTANDNDLVNGLTDTTKDISISKGTFAGIVSAADGTLAAPEYTFTNDIDSGFYRIGADNIGLSLGGNKVLDLGTTAIVINDEGDDLDFTIEGDTDTQLFKCDAGTDSVLIGSNANTTDFSASKLIISYSNTTFTLTDRCAIIGESQASGAGVAATAGYFIGQSNSADAGVGVTGRGKVGAAANTGIAYGGNFVADDAHTGANNIAVYASAANASGSGKNIAIDVANGDIRIGNAASVQAADANTLHIGCEDLSAGNTQLVLYGEGTSVGTGTPAANRTVALKVNGTQYYLIASTSAV